MSDSKLEETIWIVTDDTLEVPIEGKRGWGEEVQQRVLAARKISVTELETRMSHFLGVVNRLFNQAEAQAAQLPTAKPGMKLDEIELAIEITGGGEIKLIAGGKAEAKGAIKLKFKRVS
ncbi:MAG: hypothetical protein LH702_16245 [Phormidesmis sp. CAN_BIN44]|nr:hypothetical protein [Phormidesmis sp. CAN_BIN44]